MASEKELALRQGAGKENEVVITRIFNAPRQLVFKAWTRPEYLRNWYAPKNGTVEFYQFDFKVDGKFIHRIQNAEGYSCLCKGVYHEIVVPEKIVFSIWFCDEDGKFREAVSVGMHEGWPDVTTVTVSFEEYNRQTRLTLYQTVSERKARETGAYAGWIEMLDKLEQFMPLEIADSEFIICS